MPDDLKKMYKTIMDDAFSPRALFGGGAEGAQSLGRVEVGAAHTEGLEDVLAAEDVEGLARNNLDDGADQHGAVVEHHRLFGEVEFQFVPRWKHNLIDGHARGWVELNAGGDEKLVLEVVCVDVPGSVDRQFDGDVGHAPLRNLIEGGVGLDADG